MRPLFQVSTHRLKQDAQRASILNLAGRSVELLFQFAGLAILARLLTPGLPWGAMGVAAGLAAANLLLFVPAFLYATKGPPSGLAMC
jgi:hypothetical protein